tara:strand:+ start:50 stop:169 length:120 start_codon:yes stop_codon:yes gene_type:complete
MTEKKQITKNNTKECPMMKVRELYLTEEEIEDLKYIGRI